MLSSFFPLSVLKCSCFSDLIHILPTYLCTRQHPHAAHTFLYPAAPHACMHSMYLQVDHWSNLLYITLYQYSTSGQLSFCSFLLKIYPDFAVNFIIVCQSCLCYHIFISEFWSNFRNKQFSSDSAAVVALHFDVKSVRIHELWNGIYSTGGRYAGHRKT